jgi:hypothetical protein
MSKLEVDAIEPQSGTTLTIGASGDSVTLGSGASLTSPGLTLSDNILFNTADKGIYLGVTSATASNLLDDYEEGTWTPSITSGFASFTVQNATYTKIGRTVNIQFYANGITSKNSSQVIIGGLPFTSRSNIFSTGSVEASSGKIGISRVAENNTYFSLFYADVSTGNRNNLIGTDLGTHIILSFTYEV